jgi:hypothetical protein
MSKVEVQRNYWYKILDHYHNILNEKFLHQPLTPFTQHFIKIAFDNAVNEAKRRETHPAWHVPLTLRFDIVKHQVIIEATDPNTIEFT